MAIMPWNTIEVGPDESARLVARRRTNDCKKSILRQLLCAPIAFQASPEKAIERLTIACKEFLERLARPGLEFQHQSLIANHRPPRLSSRRSRPP